MLILHVCDFHFNQRWFDWLAKRAPSFDAVCYAGDWLDMFDGKTEPHAQTRWCKAWMAAFPSLLIGCSGNHDISDLRPDSTGASASDDQSQASRSRRLYFDEGDIVVHGTRFHCVPWDGMLSLSAREPLILLSHAPPQGSRVAWQGGEDFGSLDVADFAATMAPGSLILSGHVHEPASWASRLGSTVCLNPGHNIDRTQAVPNHIVIDTKKHTARAWLWGKDRGAISLNHPSKR